MRWLCCSLVLVAGCRTRPWVPVERGDGGDLAAPGDLAAGADLATVDLSRPPSGCADGTREGFLDLARFPNIAGCAGAFLVPGVLSSTFAPACGRLGGDDGPRPGGDGCDVEDLCAAGWHVCRSAADVSAHSPSGCDGAAPAPALFFVTRQSSTGCGVCATGDNLANPPCNSETCAPGCAQTDATANDVFGCGSVGATPDSSCGVLDRFGHNHCEMLPSGWSCGADPDPGFTEARLVVHLDGAHGGALCCRD